MRLELHIGGELVGEMTFADLNHWQPESEEAFNKRTTLIEERVNMFKRQFLLGYKTKMSYEIYFFQQSRMKEKVDRLKRMKDYRPEGESTFSHKVGRTNIADLK